MKKMKLKELQEYLGITDNDSYMARAKQIRDFRQLEKLVENMDNVAHIEIIRKDDFYINKLNTENKIIYEYNDLIVYEKNIR